MKNIVKRVLVLGLISVLSGLTLSKVYNYANPKIIANQEKAIEKAVFTLLPLTENYELKSIENKNIYFCYDKTNNLTGYVFKAEGMGYQGQIVVMVGLDKDLAELKGIEILEYSETPGLGAKIVTEAFRKQFKGLKICPIIEYTKKESLKDNQIEAITGATVTSKSIVNILNQKIKKIISVLKTYNK